jgi:hypothetical protein
MLSEFNPGVCRALAATVVPLIAQLRSPVLEVQCGTALALRCLGADGETRTAIVAAGAIPALLSMSAASYAPQARECAAAALGCLRGDERPPSGTRTPPDVMRGAADASAGVKVCSGGSCSAASETVPPRATLNTGVGMCVCVCMCVCVQAAPARDSGRAHATHTW